MMEQLQPKLLEIALRKWERERWEREQISENTDEIKQQTTVTTETKGRRLQYTMFLLTAD